MVCFLCFRDVPEREWSAAALLESLWLSHHLCGIPKGYWRRNRFEPPLTVAASFLSGIEPKCLHSGLGRFIYKYLLHIWSMPLDTQETRGSLSGKLLALCCEIYSWNHVLSFTPGFPTSLLFWHWSNHLTFFPYIFAFLLKNIHLLGTGWICLFNPFLFIFLYVTRKNFGLGVCRWELKLRAKISSSHYKKPKSMPNLEMSAHGNSYSQPVKYSLVLLDFELCECADQQHWFMSLQSFKKYS